MNGARSTRTASPATGTGVLRRLLGLLYPHRWWVAAGVLLSFATVGANIGLMAMSAYLISKAALTNQFVDLSLAVTGVRFFAIARAALRYSERVVNHRTTFHILTYLRAWFYRAIEPLAPARLQHTHSGDLLARLVGDIETLENFYVRVVVPPLAAALTTALACAILGRFDFWLGVGLLVFLALTGVALPLLSRWLSSASAQAQVQARASLNSALVDQVQGLADILAFDHAGEMQNRLRVLDQSLNRAQERLALIRGLGDGLAALFTGLAGLTILFLAIPLVSGGELEGVFLALLPLTAIASFEAVQPLALAFQNLETSQAAAQRLFELIDARPEVDDLAGGEWTPVLPAGGYEIEVRNLSFRYASGEPPALEGLNLHVPAGACVALVGSSGAGKSTLVNLLLRFWDYSDGEIRLGGRDLRAYRAEDVRQLLGVVSQQVHLFNGTLADNLFLANPEASSQALAEACRVAQLDDLIRSLPQGLETLIGENGLLLSGGERQRLAIARALLKDVPILILDEATAHLDALTAERFWDDLKPWIVGRTTLIITHQPAGLELAEQVIDLENLAG